MSMMKNKKNGFTLVEVMVSVSIFTIVMVSATVAYLNLIALDKQTRSTNDVVDNLSFALDSMARSIRLGTSYDCLGGPGGNCPSGGTQGFQFIDSSGTNTVTYLLANGAIATCTNIVCTAASATPLTDSRVTVDKLTFYVRGVGADGVQPQVIIVMHGTLATDSKHAPQTFTIETMTTERGIDS
jgi:prepilin-type N-terminal cleavage/methylation domain-containing protein